MIRPRRLLTLGGGWWAIFVIVLMAFLPPIRSGVGLAVRTISQPIASWSQRWQPAGAKDQLVRERDQLRDQVQSLTLRLAEANQKIELSGAASQLTSYLSTTRGRNVTAEVIAFSPDPGIESVVISRGSADGLQPGLAVITGQGLLIGKIAAVREQTSTVLLLTDSHSTIAARIQNDQQSPGIVAGERGLAIAMNFLPKNDVVKAGQIVVTSGLETRVPPDVVIGTVGETTSRSGELFRHATIISPVQFSRIRIVAVVDIP